MGSRGLSSAPERCCRVTALKYTRGVAEPPLSGEFGASGALCGRNQEKTRRRGGIRRSRGTGSAEVACCWRSLGLAASRASAKCRSCARHAESVLHRVVERRVGPRGVSIGVDDAAVLETEPEAIPDTPLVGVEAFDICGVEAENGLAGVAEVGLGLDVVEGAVLGQGANLVDDDLCESFWARSSHGVSPFCVIV